MLIGSAGAAYRLVTDQLLFPRRLDAQALSSAGPRHLIGFKRFEATTRKLPWFLVKGLC